MRNILPAVFLVLAGPQLSANLVAQQPSRETLLSAAREIMTSVDYAALITLDDTGHPRVRTMEPFPPDDNMVIWLGTNRRTRKVEQIANDARVTLYYQAPNGGGYVSIYGTARLVDDPAEKARHWNPSWDEFYPDRDETYLLIQVTPRRLEIVSYRHDLVGDPNTWTPFSVDFPDP